MRTPIVIFMSKESIDSMYVFLKRYSVLKLCELTHFSLIHQTKQHYLKEELAAVGTSWSGAGEVVGADINVAVVDAVVEDCEPDEVPHVVFFLRIENT